MYTLAMVQEQLNELIYGELTRLVLHLFVCLYCLTNIVRAVYNIKKRRWAGLYFILLCTAVLVWSAGSLLAEYVDQPAGYCLRFTGLVFVPALICLHVWKQVSYRDITPLILVTALAAPVAFSGAALYSLLHLQAFPGPLLGNIWGKLAVIAYAVVAVARAYLLCLNVFYQMPRHMRKSTYSMLSGLSVLTLACLALFVWDSYLGYDFLLLMTTISLSFFYTALRRLVSADVIVTSRDFVFNSIGTTVLVLSTNRRILDWNKKGAARDRFLPAPRYREHYEHYRKRIMREGKGKVSPHDDDMITVYEGDTERHYLISFRQVSSKQHEYGQLVEISEVTPLYAKFRYLEEIAMVDQLTGLYNRNAYIATVKQLMVADKMPLVIVVGDVNNLKPLNDKHGHLHGDELLKTVANAITSRLPQTGYAYRIGGDEYVALMPNTTGDAAQPWIDSVNEILAGVNDSHFGVPGVSWGYAEISSAEQDYNEIFMQADQMMYAKKRAARRFKSSGFVPAADEAPAPAPAEDKPLEEQHADE